MSYVVLYRKYRPNSFSTVIGQENIKQILLNSIKFNKISNAYIFSGPKGTGKTSIAKIFAKAVNCLHPIEGDACNNCEVCKEINGATVSDIIELDAASNNGVDDIRNIIDSIKFLPISLSKKVYIIDEAHMLTIQAWNALLKTIEETPKHVILIFSTTEIHKIPSPILSRSQQFFFTRINNEKLKNMIRNICKNENIQIDVESVNKIVELADGSARDALTFLDQLVMFTNNNIDVKSINMLFALIDDKVKINFLNLIKKQQTEQVLNLFNEFIANGIDIVKLTMQLIDLLIQKLTYLKTKNLSLINVDVSELNLSESECLKYIDTFNNSYSKMKFSSDPNFYLKLAFFSLIEKKVEAINIKEEITEQKQTIAKPVALEKDENKLPNLKDVFNTSIINLNTKTQEEPVSTPKQKEPISVIEKNNDIELLFFQIAFNHDKKYKLMFDKIFDSIKSLDNLKLLNLTTNAIKSIICSKNGVVLQFSDELDSDLLNSKYLNHELLLEIQQYWKTPLYIIGFSNARLRELTNKFIINKNNGIKYDEPDLKVLHKIIDDSNDILKYVKNNLI